MNEQTNPSIWVGCLAAYNNGHLHGKWIEVTTTDEIQDEINNVLNTSPVPGAEEWDIFDHEGLGSDISCDLEEIVAKADFMKEHGDVGIAVLGHCGGDLEDAQNMLDNYCGEYDNEIAYAEELFQECYAHDMPENLRYYFDTERFARDLFLDGYISLDSNNHTVFVFQQY